MSKWEKYLAPLSFVSSSLKVGMACLVLLMYLLATVTSRLALMFSPSFFGVRTTLMHQSVGSSPTSSMMSISSHLLRIWWNLSLSSWDILLCFCTAPFASGSTRNFTLTPFNYNFPKTENTSLYSSFRSTVACLLSPMTGSGVLEVRSRWYFKRPLRSAAWQLSNAVRVRTQALRSPSLLE